MRECLRTGLFERLVQNMFRKCLITCVSSMFEKQVDIKTNVWEPLEKLFAEMFERRFEESVSNRLRNA